MPEATVAAGAPQYEDLSAWDAERPTFTWRDAGLCWQYAPNGSVSACLIDEPECFLERFPGEPCTVERAAELIELNERHIPDAVFTEAEADFRESEEAERREWAAEQAWGWR